jgi:oxidoreductase, short chain dehydrogenase/reductase family
MRFNPFSLDGKTILITGASSGIGRATAIECAAAGARTLVLVGRRQSSLEETASIMATGCDTRIELCDISVAEEVQDMVERLPVLDGVVLNAGMNKMRPVQFITEKDLDSIFSINCFSPMLTVKQLVKKKKLASSSSIVFTSSISGYTNVSLGNATYGASKNALTAFMKYSALELAARGIRCNAVHPGRIDTPLIHSGITDEEMNARDMERYPLKRYGRPEEVAYAIVYLLSEAAAWITGSSLVIDGGRSLV